MMENIEHIKEGFLSIYEMEAITAKDKNDIERITSLG